MILAAATAIAVVVAGRVLPTLIPTNNLLNFNQTNRLVGLLYCAFKLKSPI